MANKKASATEKRTNCVDQWRWHSRRSGLGGRSAGNMNLHRRHWTDTPEIVASRFSRIPGILCPHRGHTRASRSILTRSVPQDAVVCLPLSSNFPPSHRKIYIPPSLKNRGYSILPGPPRHPSALWPARFIRQQIFQIDKGAPGVVHLLGLDD